MSPTLHDGDIILCSTRQTFPNKMKEVQTNKNAHKHLALSKDDIIIFKSTNHSGQNWIKRITRVIHHGTLLSLDTMSTDEVRSIITGDGNHFVIRNNTFYINGKKSTTYKTQQNFYYVNGNNQQTSYDSRHFGYIAQANIIAIAQCGLISIFNKRFRLFFTLRQ